MKNGTFRITMRRIWDRGAGTTRSEVSTVRFESLDGRHVVVMTVTDGRMLLRITSDGSTVGDIGLDELGTLVSGGIDALNKRRVAEAVDKYGRWPWDRMLSSAPPQEANE